MSKRHDTRFATDRRATRRLSRGLALLLAAALGTVGLAAGPAQADVVPTLTLAVTSNAANPASANGTFQYTLALRNTAPVNADASVGKAYQIADLVVALPSDIKYVSLSSITVTGGVTPPGVNVPPTYTPTGSGFGGTLTFSGVRDLPAGGSTSIVYNAQIDGAPLAGQSEVSTATIASYADQPSGTPGNTFGPLQAQGAVAITGRSLTTTAALISPSVNGASGRTTIGDQVRYTTTYTVPNGVTLSAASIGQCLPLGFRYVAGTYLAVTTGGTLPGFTSPNTESAGRFDSRAVDTSGLCAADQQYLSLTLPDVANSGPAISLQIQLTALITGEDDEGTLVLSSYPGANKLTTAGSPNDNNASFINSGSRNGTAESGAVSGSVGGGNADNSVYVPHLTLGADRARPASPAAGGTTVDFLVSLTDDGGAPAHQLADLGVTFDAGLTDLAAYQSDATCQTTTAVAGATQSGQTLTIPTSVDPLAPGSTSYVCVRATLPTDAPAETAYAATVELGDASEVGAQYNSAPATYAGHAYGAVGAASASISTPPSADLGITVTDGVATATSGQTVTYTIGASNAGPSSVVGATVTDAFPATLTATWTCIGAGGGSCTASGAGDIEDSVDLPSGGSVTYTVTAAVSATATGTLTNAASVAAPTGVIDPVSENDSASDIDTLVSVSTTTGTPSATNVATGTAISLSAEVTGVSPTGTVTFTACGPLESADGCATGGTAVGVPKALQSGAATSDPFTPTEVGVYCFRAEYGGDAANLPSLAAAASQCVTVRAAPVVTTEPVDQTVDLGSDAVFTASAAGDPTPTVQWQVDDGSGWSDVAGATRERLVVPSTTLAADGLRYRALFHNAAGDATSRAASLHVTMHLAVVTQPVDVTVLQGGRAVFTAAASGAPAPTVRWQQQVDCGWSDLPGATTPTLTIDRARPALDGKRFRAVFTNATGSVVTDAAALDVARRVAFTSDRHATFRTGRLQTFTIRTTGVSVPTLSVAGALPAGLHLKVHHNGTATLRGRATTPGRYPLTVRARNAGSAVQHLVVTVSRLAHARGSAPRFSSAAKLKVDVGSCTVFKVRTTGYPEATLSASGAIPPGMTWRARQHGNAVLRGLTTRAGTYRLTITADNGRRTVQHLVVVVRARPE